MQTGTTQCLLVIDDEEGIRRSIKRALRQEPYEILMAESGAQALQIVQNHPDQVAVAISDYKMPGMDGIETLSAIGDLNAEITRIILTGYATLESAIQATNAGLDGFLTKPFENEELRAKIREYFLKKHMKQFVSPQIMRELQRNPDVIQPRKCKVSVLFSDIRGFTPMAERLDPHDLAYLLNHHYFSPLGKIVLDNLGTIDKHIGDAIMSLFGAPIEADDDPYRAVKTALDMRAQMRLINAQLAGRRTGELLLTPLAGGHYLPVGYGISTGEVVAGLLGSASKKEYTALGQAVNVASRLQNLAKAEEILICQTTYAEIREQVRVEALDPTPIKGISQPVQIYRVLDLH
ncbi:MAG: adenylate/guanylate cyclase domain-containing protein [Candidatus Sericytochromatia bacterium]